MAAKRKRCSVEGCRRLRVKSSEYCGPCGKNGHLKPENLNTMSEIEALRFGKSDMEIRNHILNLQFLDREIENTRLRHAETVRQLTEKNSQKLKELALEKVRVQELLKTLKPAYDKLVEDIAKEHGIEDPRKMVVDPDTYLVTEVGQGRE